MKAYLDNQLISDNSFKSELRNPSISIRRDDETGAPAFGFTSDLRFMGDEYTYLYSKLVADTNALNNEVELKIVNDCCSSEQTYTFKITHKTIEWCEGECEIKAAALEKSEESEALICLKNTLIWDNYAGFQNKAHPRMTYCNELRPDWLMDVILILGVIVNLLMLVLTPILFVIGVIVNIINAIITAVNVLPGVNINKIDFDGDPSTNVFQDMKNWKDQINNFIIGCGRKHPSPLVRDYAQNVCGKCGLTFVSSIYNDVNSAYYNTVFMNAPVHKGVKVNDNTTYWIDENKPLLSGEQFFNQLKPVHNAKWGISGNVLKFERVDKFKNTTPWIDLTSHPNVLSVCWTWNEEESPSYASFYYSEDAVNWVGSEAINRWGDTVEWNNPYSPVQKGEFKPLLQFAACRFRDDGIDRDVLSAYKGAPFIGNVIKQYNNVIIMNSHKSYTPMLLIWDPATGKENAKVSGSSFYFGGFPGVAVNQFYNYPFWYNENYSNNLYTDFYYINNPKLTTLQHKKFTAVVKIDCDLLDDIDIEGTVMTSLGEAQTLQIDINFGRNEITILGKL